MIKIPFTPISLDCQKPTEVQDCYIELHNSHLEYVMRFFADEPVNDDDKTLGEESVFNSFHTTVMKRSISGIEKAYTKNKKWRVSIIISGFAEDIKAYFKLESQAIEYRNKLHEWLLK